MRNPFKTLGFNPEVLRGLSDEEIKNIVKTMYRQLQLVFHPDKAKGNEKRSRELNEAYAEIGPDSNKEDFDFHKKEFLKITKSGEMITSLEDKVIKLQGDMNSLDRKSYDKFWEFFSIASGMVSDESEMNVFQIRNTVLKLQDYIHAQNQLIMESMNSKDSFFSLIFDDQGRITRQSNNGQCFELPNKKLIGTIGEDEVRKRGSIGRLIREMTGQRFSTVYEGDFLRAANIIPRNGAFKMLPPKDPPKPEKMENYIGFESFFGLCRMLSPFVEKNSYLFSANISGGEIFFKLEGKVLDIKKNLPA